MQDSPRYWFILGRDNGDIHPIVSRVVSPVSPTPDFVSVAGLGVATCTIAMWCFWLALFGSFHCTEERQSGIELKLSRGKMG